jgi:hypothetical protein
MPFVNISSNFFENNNSGKNQGQGAGENKKAPKKEKK